MAKTCSQTAEEIDILFELLRDNIELLKLMLNGDSVQDYDVLSQCLQKSLHLQRSLNKSKEYFNSGDSNTNGLRSSCFPITFFQK